MTKRLTKEPGPMERLASQYKVPIKRGRLISFGSEIGRITSVRRGYLRITLRNGRRFAAHARETGMVYLDDDGQTVICDPACCSNCGAKGDIYYHLCLACLPQRYRKLLE